MPQGNHIERIHDSYSKAAIRSIIHCSCLFFFIQVTCLFITSLHTVSKKVQMCEPMPQGNHIQICNLSYMCFIIL